MWRGFQAQQLSFLLEGKHHYPISDLLEAPLNSTFQSFQRTLCFHRISVAHLWTSDFCWSPVLLCVPWGCGQSLTASQMWNGQATCPAPKKHHPPKPVPCCAHQPYTALEFFNPILFPCPNRCKTLFLIIFMLFNFFSIHESVHYLVVFLICFPQANIIHQLCLIWELVWIKC